MTTPNTPDEGRRVPGPFAVTPRDPDGSAREPLNQNGRLLQVRRAPEATLAMLADPRSAAAEAYRSLAATLQYARAEAPLQTIGVTSAAPNDGKSAAVANMAVALAEGGRRVVVIDADLRRPSLHTLFGTSAGQGLSNVLLGELHQLPLQDTSAPGVSLLSSGPAPVNPLEALASARFEHVLELARAQADFVLVDTAPAGALADAAVLAPRLDGVLLVVSAGRTRRELAKRARDQLERVNANLLGVVLVDVRDDDKLYKY